MACSLILVSAKTAVELRRETLVDVPLTMIEATYARRKKACPAPEPFPTDSANLTRFIPGTALALGDGVGKLERNEPRFRL